MGARQLSANDFANNNAVKPGTSNLVNRNVIAGRGRTSMRLEPELWEALNDICRMERIGLSELIRSIEARGHPGGRTSAVRVYIVQYFRGLVVGRGSRITQPAHQPPSATLPSSSSRSALGGW